MARELAPDLDVRRGETKRPYPEDVIFDWRENGRAFDPDPARVDWVANSLEAEGQLQPVVFSVTHDRKLKLEAGFYRLLGMLKLNSTRPPEKRMRLEGTVKDGNPEEMFLKNLAENRVRNKTTVVDDAHNARRLSEQFGKTDEEICAIYGTPGKPMSPAWLEDKRKILSLSKAEQQRIHSGELSASIGYMLADMDPAKRNEVLEDAAADGGKVTTTSVLKSARRKNALSNSPALKMPEVRTAWVYLKEADKTKHPKVAKLAEIVCEWQDGKLPEPDFYTKLHKLFG